MACNTTQLLLSQKYKQLTKQLQFDYYSSLTMNRRDTHYPIVGGAIHSLFSLEPQKPQALSLDLQQATGLTIKPC